MEPERDLIYWMPSFYVLEDLSVCFTPAEASPSLVRLRNDIAETRKHFNTLLSGLLFDMLVKMCFGEARHARKRCGMVISEIDRTMSKKEAYKLAEQCDPNTALPKLRELFLECRLQPYGGSVWAGIAETAMKYRSVPHELFIDSCLELSYQGGLVFDDIETGFHVRHKRNYFAILDCKRNRSLLDAKGTLPVFHYVAALLRRAHRLNVIPAVPPLAISYHGFYLPVRWGGAPLSDPQSVSVQRMTGVTAEAIMACACERC